MLSEKTYRYVKNVTCTVLIRVKLSCLSSSSCLGPGCCRNQLKLVTTAICKGKAFFFSLQARDTLTSSVAEFNVFSELQARDLYTSSIKTTQYFETFLALRKSRLRDAHNRYKNKIARPLKFDENFARPMFLQDHSPHRHTYRTIT